jgi:predicted RNase H-like HicB family nuclease
MSPTFAGKLDADTVALEAGMTTLFEVKCGEAEDGYVITSPLFPELVTGGATLRESIDYLRDALTAVLEMKDEESFQKMEKDLRRKAG